MANEKRLLDAKDVKELINGLSELPWEEEVDYLVDSLPTVDAVEVVHGRWENPSKYGLSTMMDKLGNICSACASYCDNRFNYCPHCGAKMDMEVDK